MIRLAKAAWGLVTGSRHNLAMYAVAAAAAALYVWGRSAAADRDAVTAWASATCQVAGATYTDTSDKSPCREAVRGLVAYRQQSQDKTNAALAKSIEDQAHRSAADLALATDQAAARLVAASQMERQNNEVSNDTVGPAWFAALNGVAGLRAEGD